MSLIRLIPISALCISWFFLAGSTQAEAGGRYMRCTNHCVPKRYCKRQRRCYHRLSCRYTKVCKQVVRCEFDDNGHEYCFREKRCRPQRRCQRRPYCRTFRSCYTRRFCQKRCRVISRMRVLKGRLIRRRVAVMYGKTAVYERRWFLKASGRRRFRLIAKGGISFGPFWRSWVKIRARYDAGKAVMPDLRGSYPVDHRGRPVPLRYEGRGYHVYSIQRWKRRFRRRVYKKPRYIPDPPRQRRPRTHFPPTPVRRPSFPPRIPSRPPRAPAARGQCGMRTMESQVLRLVNQERRRRGAKPLRCHAKLVRASRDWSRQQCRMGSLSHARLSSRFNALGVSWSRIAENVAAGQTSARSVMRSWMTSPGHRRNILNPALTHLGVGFYRCNRGYSIYWTQMFMRTR